MKICKLFKITLFNSNNKKCKDIHDINYHNILMEEYDEDIRETQPEIVKNIIKMFCLNNEIKSIKSYEIFLYKNWIIKFENTTIKLEYKQNKDIEEYYITVLDIKNNTYRITRSQFNTIENSIKYFNNI